MADPLRKVCLNDIGRPACTEDADCNNFPLCVDISEPTSVGLFCIPPTTSDVINAAGGIPGPAAIQLNSLLVVTRCGDRKLMPPEECDDGNLRNGDGCDQDCKTEP